MAPPSTIYCIDTSSVLKWFVEVYPPSLIPGLVPRIGGLIAAKRLQAPKAVMDEIKAGDDCHEWAKAQTDLFHEESQDVQRIVRDLMAKHHNPQKPQKGINGADPFVIAMAKAGGSNWAVVSDEHPGSLEQRKIPFVCKAEGVACMNFQAMMHREGWQFH